MSKNINIVCGDDWIGMYINGKLAVEGHSLDYDDVLTALCMDYAYDEVGPDWLGQQGGVFPEDLGGVFHYDHYAFK